jgi:hypothetical protein
VEAHACHPNYLRGRGGKKKKVSMTLSQDSKYMPTIQATQTPAADYLILNPRTDKTDTQQQKVKKRERERAKLSGKGKGAIKAYRDILVVVQEIYLLSTLFFRK